MSWNWNSHGLPFLPGYTFRDITKSDYHRSQTLGYRNGYALSRRPILGIGQDPLLSEQLRNQEFTKLTLDAADLTYGPFEKSPPEEFVPDYVALDKKVLRFNAYFEEEVRFSSDDVCRVRPVIIYFYLEDDSMCIFEPLVKNSGIPQGRRLKRQRAPKNERGERYRWSDLNIGMDLEVYGVKYRITQCDAFTKEFMESEGLVLNDPQPTPVDPYCKTHKKLPKPCHKTPSDADRTYQFLKMDRMVLRFYATWDNSDSLHADTMPVSIQYYLVDDTVEIREVHQANSGRYPFPVLMHRQKLPKKLKPKPFDSCVLEVSKDEVDEYFSPRDFKLGQTIRLLGRLLLLQDCDGFTREYFEKNYPDVEMKPVAEPKAAVKPPDTKEAPPYNGFGSLEDSLQNCLSLIPEPPRHNVRKMLENHHKVLRYIARMESQNPNYDCRRFILSYFLSDDMISIYEKPTRNSGIISGKFLEKTRVPKPGYTVDHPRFYSPADLAIGATVDIFSHRFVLIDADQYVLNYLESISSQIPCETLESMRQKLGRANNQPGVEVADPSS